MPATKPLHGVDQRAGVLADPSHMLTPDVFALTTSAEMQAAATPPARVVTCVVPVVNRVPPRGPKPGRAVNTETRRGPSLTPSGRAWAAPGWGP